MATGATTRTCPKCRAPFADDRGSAYCVACQAVRDETFRQASNQAATAFAAIARQHGDEAEARRIERTIRH